MNNELESILRIIDANLNRGREGLRVCEDILRFASSDKNMAAGIKKIRHAMTEALLQSGKISLKRLALTRDTGKDALKCVDFKKPKGTDARDIFMANTQRVKESLRVLEECCKIIDKNLSCKYRDLRFKVYDMEKKALELPGIISCNR
jgi:hypothetical protein